jgi:Protein of unknown function (DUF3631)
MSRLMSWREGRADEELLENERAAEAWEPLVAIAKLAGRPLVGRLPKLALMTHAEREVRVNVKLLMDCRAVFAARSDPDAIASRDLRESLTAIEGSPWSTFLGGWAR